METIDYEKVLADLEARRAAFNSAVDAAINGIRHVLSAVATLPAQPTAGPHTTPTLVSGSSMSLSPDAFFGMSIAEAAVKYLSVVKRQQRSREIAEALETAGYHHTSTNFTNTVNTALYRRAKDDGDVVRIGRNWALAEWYPGRRKPTKSASNTRGDDIGEPVPDDHEGGDMPTNEEGLSGATAT